MSYQNVIFTYDEIGNPLTYYNGTSYTFGWEGRRLTSATRGATSFSFTYNDEGIRTSKVVNGVEHTYILDGSQIAAEIWGSNILVYLYDSNGAPIGMQYRFAGTSYTWETYWFEKNLQGDIVAIYSNDGTKILSYTYDAWGNHEVEYHVSSNNVVQYNPFRYRGYYFDEDLGMYYLQSRYYDPAIGRFINADSMISSANGSLDGNNLFAYCNNNPTNLTDASGNWPFWGIVTFVFIIVTVINHTENICNKAEIDEELPEKLTNEEADVLIKNCVSHIEQEKNVSIDVTINDNDIVITNSYLITDKYDRQYISSVIARTEGVTRSAGNLSAEWFGHNVMYIFPSTRNSTKDVNLDKVGDERDWVRFGTKLLEVLGWE